MAANAMSWPLAVFPKAAMFHLENQSRSGGVSMTGSEQVTSSPAGRWKARVNGPVVTEESVLAWRAFVSMMNGRAGTVLVPKWDNYGVRDANGRQFNEVGGAGFADGLNFDLSGFGQADVAYALAGSAAASGATQIAVHVLDGEGPRPGQYFGVGNRFYLVQLAWHTDASPALNLQFSPRLRAAVPAGARVILDDPVCLMRFATDQTGELELDMGRWGQGGLEFIEASPETTETVEVWTGEISTAGEALFALNFAFEDNSQYLPAL